MKTVILLSGGIDSAACVSFYSRLGHPVEALFVDYGQPTRVREKASATDVASHYSIPLEIVVCHGPKGSFAGEIVGRNAFLIITAMLYKLNWKGIIALGIHAGTPYYDCKERFVVDISRIMDGYSDGRLVLGVPFLSWTKDMIWNYCSELNVPVALTWSCEVGPTKPCGTCRSCKDREAIYARSSK